MGTTRKGIIYPSDYEQGADIPADMKKMAESIDGVIEDLDNRKANESDLTDLMYELFGAEGRLDTAEDDIDTLKTDNETNKTNIATLQSNSGHTIEISLDNTTYILTATLKNNAGEVLNTSTADFPVEQLVLDVHGYSGPFRYK